MKLFVFTPAGTVGFFASLGLPAIAAYATMALELGGAHLHGLVSGRRKITRDLGRGTLRGFDLAADAAEQKPLSPIPGDLEAELVAWEEDAMGAEDSRFFWPYEPAPSELIPTLSAR